MINIIKEKVLNNKILILLLCIFIVIQPFLDILPLFENAKYQIFGFTIPTLIRLLCMFSLGIICIFIISKKHLKFIIIYTFILIIYFILHNYVCGYGSTMNIPDNYKYSISQEIFYIIRMVIPLIIIYITAFTSIPYKKFIKTILIASAIIGTIIFVGNTFCISYVSYGEGRTVANWISWFSLNIKNFGFEELTSKGWFYMANQVSGICVMLFPFNIYEMVMNKSKLSYYSTIVLLLGMIMLGTRVASFGWILVCIAFIFSFIYLKYFKHNKQLEDKKIFNLIFVIAIGLVFLFVSPINRREYGYSLGDVDSLEERPVINENNDEAVKYIYDNYETYGIQKVYLKIYDCNYDPEFWYYIFDYSKVNSVIENRELEMLISKRIQSNNPQLKYTLFGYSFSRMRSAKLYIEHDFIAQAMTMGIIGAFILICPYIIAIFIVVRKIFKQIKIKSNLFDLVFLISISSTLFASFLTGHILDELFVTIYLGFICGFFIKKLIPREEKYES